MVFFLGGGGGGDDSRIGMNGWMSDGTKYRRGCSLLLLLFPLGSTCLAGQPTSYHIVSHTGLPAFLTFLTQKHTPHFQSFPHDENEFYTNNE